MTAPGGPKRRRRNGIGATIAWAVVAAIIAVGQVIDRARDETPADEAILPPVLVLGEPELAPVRVVALPPAPPVPAASTGRATRSLPRPFAAMHAFASPLIMPRLHLPRVLSPRLSSLTELLERRARPGQPVAVTLTAYCLDGTTRRGRPVRPGIVAADPRVFPLARHVELFAAGHYLGRFLVDDTGDHVRGQRIDIWTPDCEDARRFGTRSGVATLVAVD
jgi:3D (Asp-Asp-Asp) domain-containing protein